MEQEVVLKLDDISKVFTRGSEEVHALKSVDISVKKGDFLALVGPSGSGKSTLLNVMAGLDVPTSGTVMFKGEDISSIPAERMTDLRLRDMGIIFQQFHLISILTAMENVALPMKEAGVEKELREKRAVELLNRMGLDKRIDHLPGQLSGGEQQRVAIARALANGPAVLFADEPTGELDSANARRIVDLLASLNKEDGVTIVMVTHDLSLTDKCSRVVEMKDGRIC